MKKTLTFVLLISIILILSCVYYFYYKRPMSHNEVKRQPQQSTINTKEQPKEQLMKSNASSFESDQTLPDGNTLAK